MKQSLKIQIAGWFGAAASSVIMFGYGANIYKLSQMDWSNLSIEALLRILGVPVFPIGIFMGLFV